MFSLSVLGPWQSALDGVALTNFRSVKNQALLVYLALNAERPQMRITLATLLWPAESEARARLNLRQALFQLRSLLHAGAHDGAIEYLTTTAQTVQFNRQASHTVDALAFTELIDACARHAHTRLDCCDACAERLIQAVQLYRGDFLQGMFVDDSAPLEEWILWRRQQLQQQMLSVLYTLASWCEQRGEYDRTYHYAQRQLEIDALSEEAYQQEMRALVQLGRWQEALAQYEQCRKLLKQELAVVPSEVTQRLYAEIKERGQPVISLTPLPASTSPLVRPARHNLPLAPNRFVGRQDELTALHRQLLDPACRLITILGPGGVGKTRLALTLAQSLLDNASSDTQNRKSKIENRKFNDGVWFIALAGVSHVAQLPQAITTALGVRLEGRTALRQQLIDYLRSKTILLVLDNYEHLLADAALVDELLTHAPGVKLVVTSRIRLNFQKEWLYELAGLPYQPPARRGQVAVPVALDEEGAVRLFLDRVQRIGHFVSSVENLAQVQRICQLVEGYPLGIELAAALVTTMPLADIVQEIEQGLDILTTSMGDMPDRHRSLRVVFDSS